MLLLLLILLLFRFDIAIATILPRWMRERVRVLGTGMRVQGRWLRDCGGARGVVRCNGELSADVYGKKRQRRKTEDERGVGL